MMRARRRPEISVVPIFAQGGGSGAVYRLLAGVGRPVHRGQVSAPTPESAFTDLADFPHKSHEPNGIDGFLRLSPGGA
jgi:hypothetical protein